MAYFSNSSESEPFEFQCTKCKYGLLPCPIALVQVEYNYEASNNETASKILDTLVKQDGECTFWKEFQKDLEVDPNQMDLF